MRGVGVGRGKSGWLGTRRDGRMKDGSRGRAYRLICVLGRSPRRGRVRVLRWNARSRQMVVCGRVPHKRARRTTIPAHAHWLLAMHV